MISREEVKTNSSLYGGFGLVLLSTTCCALPIVLVTLGMGSTVASLISALPWLVVISEYKLVTFTITAVILGYCFLRLHQVDYCELVDQRRLQWQRVLLWTSTGLFVASVFAAYALLPVTLWWQGSV